MANLFNGLITVLECAWALLRHRPLRMAAALFPWFLLSASLLLIRGNALATGVAQALALVGTVFCIALLASTYTGLAYPRYPRPASLKEELKIAFTALWKTIVVSAVLALAAHGLVSVLGFDWWAGKYWISPHVMVLLLTFFVAEQQLKGDMSVQRLASILKALPLAVLIAAAGLLWTLGVNLVQEQVRPIRTLIVQNEDIPATVRGTFVAAYVAFFAYLRVWVPVVLFLALYGFLRLQHPPRADVQQIAPPLVR